MSVEIISENNQSVLIDNTSDVAFGPVMSEGKEVVDDFLLSLTKDARLYTTDELTSLWAAYWEDEVNTHEARQA